jgi:hypothetical protein
MDPSLSPSSSETATEGAADVLIAVDGAHVSYSIQGCPVAAWLDDSIEDAINFGTFPEYLTADDGTRWTTHMVVLRISDGSVIDWSFRLTSPLSGIPGDTERALVSLPDADNRIELAITGSEATFTTGFWDSQRTEDSLPPDMGTVSVTCR